MCFGLCVRVKYVNVDIFHLVFKQDLTRVYMCMYMMRICYAFQLEHTTQMSNYSLSMCLGQIDERSYGSLGI